LKICPKHVEKEEGEKRKKKAKKALCDQNGDEKVNEVKKNNAGSSTSNKNTESQSVKVWLKGLGMSKLTRKFMAESLTTTEDLSHLGKKDINTFMKSLGLKGTEYVKMKRELKRLKK